jgi:cytochrome P450
MALESDSQNIPSSSNGPAGWPLLGHLPHYLHDKLGYLTRCVAKHGDVVKLDIGGPTYLLNDPEEHQDVLATNHGNYEKSPRIIGEKGRSLFGEGLLTRCTAEHRPQRQMLQPAFHRRYVETFGDVMVRCTEADAGHVEVRRDSRTSLPK